MTAAEVQLDLYADRPGGFGCRTERVLYGIAISLRADLAEANAKLAERDEQIAYLLAAEPTLDDDQPGVPV
jgi:hypothetical protein